MGEGEALGVEEEAVHAVDGAFYLRVVDGVVAAFVVRGVADDGVIDRGEVDADLVRAAGFDVDVEEREFIEPLPNFPKAEGVAAVGGDSHLGAVPPVAGDRAVDGPFVLTRTAVDECDVGLLNGALAELVGEGFVSLFVFGDEDEAGGVFVEPVDDADAVVVRRVNHPVSRSGCHRSFVRRGAFLESLGVSAYRR